jgi:AhpD family alkylhydroperoxidase
MEKELAAVGMSLAAGCRPCTDFHVKAARRSGASDAEIKEAMSEAFAVRRGATFGERRPEADSAQSGPPTRIRELVCIGAAFGVNCVSTLKAHLEAAENVGISPDEIMAIANLSAFIKGKAASHVEHLVESLDKPEAAYEKAVTACCGN